jgi:hypothetical protein
LAILRALAADELPKVGALCVAGLGLTAWRSEAGDHEADHLPSMTFASGDAAEVVEGPASGNRIG